MFKNLFRKDRYFKILFYILLFINFFFFLNIYDYPWVGDDYALIFKIKLFNLINNSSLTFDPNYLESRFVPLYSILYQIMPANYVFYHLITIIAHFLTSLIIFKILREINLEKKICILSSILYSVHYSIHAKTLIWIAFWGHTLNALTGFLSIYLFFLFLKNKKKIFLTFSILLSITGILIMESGAIYPLINFFLVIFFKSRKLRILSITISPLLIYFILSLTMNNSAYNFYLKRFETNFKNKNVNFDEQKISLKSENILYFYRSTYAPRDVKGYSLRAFDNLMMSLNLSSLENTVRLIDTDNQFKFFLKKNLILIAFIFFLIFFILIFLVYKKLKILIKSKELLSFIILYFAVYFIYTVIFFRKDFSVGLSFCSVTIISIIYNYLIKERSIFLSKAILLLFVFPSILFFSSRFIFLSDIEFKKNHEKIYREYKNNLQKEFDFNMQLNDRDFKYFYFFINFKQNINYLKQFKGKSLKEYEEVF